jgi:predicted GNAT family acetyltransferase
MDDPATVALLDDPVRAALTIGHRALALGSPPAWRYPPEVGPFAAVADGTAASFAALAALVPPGDRVALVTVDPLPPPPRLTIQRQAPILQMIKATPGARERGEPDAVPLGAEDVADMVDLADRTRPGPFGRRTIECGTYLGVRVAGALAAMAGERMRFGPFVEISAVCVDPRHRGHGHAARLMRQLVRRIEDGGHTPILHVFADNAGAIALYEKLGFTLRRRLHVSSLTLDG